MPGIFRMVAVALTASSVGFLRAADISPASDSPSHTLSPNLSRQLSGLDSDDFATRQIALAGVEAVLKTPQSAVSAASQLRQVPWQTLSFEAQTKLGALGLPVFNSASTAPRSGAAFNSNITLDSEKEIALWIKQLASDRYLVRATALEGLAAAVRNSAIIRKVYSALKEAAANANTSIDARVAVYSLLDVARYTWLTASVNGDEPPPSPKQISQWIGVLVADKTASGDSANDSGLRRRTIQRTAAEWELLDGLTQDSSASAIKQAIERALERRDLDEDAAVRLGRLEAWVRPGLAVEYWQRRHNLAIQYLLIGVPSQVPGAVRPTRFDRVGNEVAVCGSGNALAPGEYPLGVAFPHPREQAAFFHLVSLPTARDRLVYQYEVKSQAEGERLRAITERTLGPALADSRPLDDAQLWLLGQLHQPTVARLLNEYFAEVPDEPIDLSQLAPMLTDISSVHRTACLMLALDGSREVVPALVACANRKRFLPLSTDEPQALAWIAALAIAAREPWEGVDSWLADLIEKSDRISSPDQQGDVGATAAALLLLRSGHRPAEFGLVAREPLRRGLLDRFESPVNADYRRRMFEDRMFKQLGVTPYYFADRESRADVAKWWEQSHPVITSESGSPAISSTGPIFTARFANP